MRSATNEQPIDARGDVEPVPVTYKRTIALSLGERVIDVQQQNG
jgi:hypothetical protein